MSSTPENSTTVRTNLSLELARTALHLAFRLGDSLGGSLAARLFTSPRRYPRPDRERAVLATGHPFTVDVALSAPGWRGAHRRIAAWKWGVGPAVLLVHGWEGRGSQLGAFVEPLVDAGMSVIAFDAPGHGDSTGRQMYLTDQADTIAAVAAAVGPLHGIIAHSFGAAAVLLAGRRNGVTAARNAFIAPNVVLDDGFFQFTQFMQLGGHERRCLEDRIGLVAGVHPAALTVERLVGDRDEALLVIHDDGDRDVSAVQGRRLTATWPGAALETTTGLGHRRILRDAGVVARVVEVVTTNAPTTASDLRRAMVNGWVEDVDAGRLAGVTS